MQRTYPLVDLLTARSLALLAAAYPAQVAAACRRQESAPQRWEGPADAEIDKLMRQAPIGPERRVA